ncbi:CRAL/TRIO domain containing protein [Novymonas esmeraldas]|uniref:CRAL/TRIO domain containing protein n=1 Tax=Novymonas esmeraldas TaxID=1808958 RepID=A0AAW0F1N5_9TRYP
MNRSSTTRLELATTTYNDGDLLSATTDCVDLTTEEERVVTDTIKALQHVLKRGAVDDGASSTPGDEGTESGTALEYLAHFSYGLSLGEARYIVYRHLRAKDMQIPKALKKLMLSAERRKKQNVDKMALFPCLIPMSGFDQRNMCEELRLPFISNIASVKRYLDAEGRLRLEQEQLDYYNVHYEDLYRDCLSAEAQPQSPQLTTNNVGWESTTPTAVTTKGGSSSTAPGAAEEKSTSNNVNDPSHSGAVSTTERPREGGEADGVGGTLRSILSFIPFGRSKGASGSGSPSPNTAGPSQASLAAAATEARRHSRFHSILSLSGGSDRGSDRGSVSDGNGAESAEMEEEEAFLKTAGAGVALTEMPNTLYADSLNFHGILEPIVAVVTKHVPFAFHYWDREGHPIMYCRLGGLHSKKLMQELFALTPIDAEPRALALLFNTYALLVLEQLVRYCNRRNREGNEIHDALLPPLRRRGSEWKKGVSSSSSCTAGVFRKRPLVGSCVVVLDCSGVKFRHYLYKPLLVMVRSIVRMNTCHYPELMHHVYVTNCNTVVSWSYLMLRSVLPEVTRQKVTFCSKSNTAATLCENISSDLVPQELGGKCQCAGGCIPILTGVTDDVHSTAVSRSYGDAHSIATTPFSDSGAEMVAQQFGEEGLIFRPLHCTVERLVLKARESRKLSFAMEARSEIIWEFAVKRERDVDFSAVFVSAGDDGAMLSLVPRRRVRNEAGHYICPSIGTVIFEWSNKHSFFTRCRLSLKVYREERTVASV